MPPFPDDNGDRSVASFGPFRLSLTNRQLTKSGAPVTMGGRALEILIALVERAGEVVSKQDLIASAWPKVFVEEANLRVQVTALRRILGDGNDGQAFIQNVARQGYVFSGRIQFSGSETGGDAQEQPGLSTFHNLPSPLQSVIGRETVVAQLVMHLAGRRLVTIAGTGGVGKTTAAIEVGRALLHEHDAVIVVDLARVTDASHDASTIKAAISSTLMIQQQPLSEPLPIPSSLIILDNCEHLLKATAEAAEELLRNSPEAKILATSREPLRAAGELVFRLSGLKVPPVDDGSSLVDPLSFAAVRLFVERAASVLGNYVPQPPDIPIIIELCRRFEGMPLAIELAAGRVDAYGIKGLGQRLDDAFQLLTTGRRTALPRHQTLQATLNWSFDQLSDSEKTTLARISVFPGLFSLDAGAELASIAEPIWSTTDDIASLVMKSLVNADFTQEMPHYRLLETTRVYARAKLRKRGEFDRLSKRHAILVQARLEKIGRDKGHTASPDRISAFATLVDDLRVCLAWCFGPNGDTELGVELAIASSTVWFELSLVSEARIYFEQAIAALEPTSQTDPARVISLLSSLGTALIYTIGPGPEVDRLWAKAARIAEASGDPSLMLDAFYGTWLSEIAGGEYRRSLATAETFRVLAHAKAENIPGAAVRIGDRLLGVSRLYVGQVSGACESLEAYIDSQSPPLSPIVRMQYDQSASARAYHAMTMWLLGRQDAALASAASCVEDARLRGHTTSLSLVLVEAGCPVPYYSGALDIMEERVDLLQSIAGRQTFGPWRAWGGCFRGALSFGRGRLEAAIEQLSIGLEELTRTRWPVRRTFFLSILAQALNSHGRFDEGGRCIEDALAMCAASGEAWHLPELLRVKAELLHRVSPEAAFTLLQQAKLIAQQNMMVAWQTRCEETTSLMSLTPEGRPAGQVP